jgi:hypothetical protein
METLQRGGGRLCLGRGQKLGGGGGGGGGGIGWEQNLKAPFVSENRSSLGFFFFIFHAIYIAEFLAYLCFQG